MYNISVSIIVPVYNVENVLDRALASIVNQTLENIEIIIVNDGTKDNSMSIVREYERKYPHIRVIEKENGGLSSARNAGLKIARGEYVAFVDSDDYILPDMMKALYENAKRYASDMVISGYYRVHTDGKKEEILSDFDRELYTGEDIISGILLPMLGALPGAHQDIENDMCVWKNLYRREAITENHIVFESERKVLSEDIIFHIDLLPNLKRVSVVNRAYYHYVQTKGSLTGSTEYVFIKRQTDLYRLIREKLSEKNLWEAARIRCSRLFMGRIRHLFNRYVYSHRRNPVMCVRYLRDGLGEEILREIFDGYPTEDMPTGSRLIAECMKYRRVYCCYFLFSLHAVK